MRIIRLQAENLKKLVAVDITPQGNVVTISGKNGAGKSSTLDAIWYALGGAENIPQMPIRKGEKEAVIRLNLGEIAVERRFTEKGSTLYVESADGARFKSPQAVLDKLVGSLSFDPLAFMRMDKKKQFETLRDLTGVDLSDLEKDRAEIAERGRIVKQDIKRLDAQIDALVVPENAPESEISATDLLSGIQSAMERNRQNDARRQALGVERAAIDKLSTEIGELQHKLVLMEQELEKRQNDMLKNEEIVKCLLDEDVQSMQAKLNDIETHNKGARARLQNEKLTSDRDMRKQELAGMEAAITAIDAEKTDRITNAKFPLSGLGFGEGVVMYNDMPLDQSSSAEQLRVSLAMAMALNPKLRVIRITDGSLLDSESMGVVEQMAESGDFQVWLEVVDESGKVGVVIDEGRVIADNYRENESAKQT